MGTSAERSVKVRDCSDARLAHRDGHKRRAVIQTVHEAKNTNTPVKGCLRHREEGIGLVGNQARRIRAFGDGDHASTGRREQLNRNAPRRVYLDENWSF